MSSSHFTLLVEDLGPLARSVPSKSRFAALERIIGRGRRSTLPGPGANHLRFLLFGQPVPDPLPVAALTHTADTGSIPGTGNWWLRADPVTLRPDLTQVFMVASGFGNASRRERRAIDQIVRDALEHAGLEAGAERNGRWCLPLQEPLDFEFTPLNEALGLDQALALPESPNARSWKRLITEIQVELQQRFRRGNDGVVQAGVNSIWFWGGGPMPAVRETSIDAVAADDPVTLGLAAASTTPVHALDGCAAIQGRVLIDWSPGTVDAGTAAASLDSLAEELLAAGKVTLVEGGGTAWSCDRSTRARFWKRAVSLHEALGRAKE